MNINDKATEALASSETSTLLGSLITPVYGVYAWFVFIVCALAALLCACCLPDLQRRRRWVTRFARLPFRLAFIPTEINGLERLPESHSVVVANHASYLDGVILQAFLPPRFSYVIKGEVRKVPVVHFLLRRIGAHFVDRYTAGASARDARSLLRAAGSGQSLAFFPEGTFAARPGLAAFRSGAFAAAIRAEVPIVPVVIQGARQILPAERLLPRRAALTINVLAALDPESYSSSKALAEAARQRILTVLDEPDLLVETPAA